MFTFQSISNNTNVTPYGFMLAIIASELKAKSDAVDISERICKELKIFMETNKVDIVLSKSLFSPEITFLETAR